MTEEDADLVAVQHEIFLRCLPSPVRQRQRAADPVGIGVAGQHEIGAGLRGLSKGEPVRRGLFRVGDPAVERGERAVGLHLLIHVMHVPVSQFLQCRAYRSHPHAVQGRVYHPDVPGVGQGHFRQDADVPLVEVPADGPDQATFDPLVERNAPNLPFAAHLRGNALVVRRHHLPAVGTVHLEPVVFGRIVAGTDHDPGRGPLIADGVGQRGGRAIAVEGQHRYAVGGEHPGRFLCEQCRVASRVPRHDDPWAGPTADIPDVPAFRPVLAEEIPRQPLCRPAHGNGIEPVRARPHAAAHSARSKGDGRAEGVFQFTGVPGIDQCANPAGEGVAGRVVQPADDGLARRPRKDVLADPFVDYAGHRVSHVAACRLSGRATRGRPPVFRRTGSRGSNPENTASPPRRQ